MLNLFNHSSNHSLLDNNLLNYGLIVGSVALLGFSLYYFSDYFIKSSTNSLGNNSLNDSENLSNVINKTYVDSSSQTDNTMLNDYLNEVIMENMIKSSSSIPSDYRASEYINDYENSIEFKNYIDGMVDWSNNVPNNVEIASRVFKNGVFPSTKSEYQYANILETIKDLKWNVIEKLPSDNPIRDYFYSGDLTTCRLLTKLHEIVNSKLALSINQVNKKWNYQ
jgi:hypothetical protein